MILLDEVRAQKLIDLARAHYNAELTGTEIRILRASASSDDPPEPDKDAPRDEVRAEFLRWLATDPDAMPFIDPKGIRVYGATIPDALDLEGCTIERILDFRFCNLRDKMCLLSAITRGLYFITAVRLFF